MTDVAALIVAAGASKRFGQPKQFAYLKGKPVLEWTLERFQAHPGIGRIVLVLPDESDRKHYESRYDKIASVVRGGERRQDSVWQGFRLLDAARTRMVLVHDGARPLVGADLISRVIAETERAGAVVPVVAVVDTLKETDEGRVVRTVDRARLVRAQTPQGFLFPVLKTALEAARADRFYGTDEAGLVERTGGVVHVIEGELGNIKITTPIDILMAEALIDV
jgi:2-C-methyl-D-erythritol 4-phosphate cytidylyltransferase